MKTLILIRHAKSSWETNIIDHDRPLSARGFSDANLVSQYLNLNALHVDLILSSDAMRAKTTAQIFVDKLNTSSPKFHLDNDLYDFSGSNLLRTIKNCQDSVKTLLIFGHNDAITAFVNAYGNRFIENVPTCGVVIINFDVEQWKNLVKGETVTTLFPRDLKNENAN